MRAPNRVPEKVSTTLPWLFKTSRQPALAVAEDPSVVGRLPTITQPLRSTDKAVVRPMPPGHGLGKFAALIWAKTLNVPLGAMSTIVVPVPCRFWLLLKLLTKTWLLTSVGPGRWSGQSGKELVLADPFLHPERERQAMEVGRYGSGVWLERRSLAWSQVPCAEQWLTVGASQLIPFGRVSSIAQLGRCLQLRKRAISEKDTGR